jgi:hypothetical protein
VLYASAHRASWILLHVSCNAGPPVNAQLDSATVVRMREVMLDGISVSAALAVVSVHDLKLSCRKFSSCGRCFHEQHLLALHHTITLQPRLAQEINRFQAELRDCAEALTAHIAQRAAARRDAPVVLLPSHRSAVPVALAPRSHKRQRPEHSAPRSKAGRKKGSSAANRSHHAAAHPVAALQQWQQSTVPVSRATLPAWVTRMPQQNDRCAAMVSSRDLWILVSVERYNPGDDTFVVVDEDEDTEIR